MLDSSVSSSLPLTQLEATVWLLICITTLETFFEKVWSLVIIAKEDILIPALDQALKVI